MNSVVMHLSDNSLISIKAVIVPDSVVSLYDRTVCIQIGCPTIEDGIKMAKRTLPAAMQDVEKIGRIIEGLHAEIGSANDKDIVIVVDRSKCTETGAQEIMMFSSNDWKVDRGHLIGFDFVISDMNVSELAETKPAVKAYLNFGKAQRVRFYPEFMMSVVAKLFLAPPQMTKSEMIQKLYSAEYKKGWRVNLDDEQFDTIYKAITGTDHESNNYYRAKSAKQTEIHKKHKFGLFEFIQIRCGEEHSEAIDNLMVYTESNIYDSDAVIEDILDGDDSNIKLFMSDIDRKCWATVKRAVREWKQIECGAENKLSITDCVHTQRLINNLKRFKEFNYFIDAANVEEFDLGQIVRGFDHLISVHNVFKGDDTVRIQRYIAHHIDCDGSDHCVVVDQFRNRERRNEKHSESNRIENVSSKCAVLREILCAVHCYLLHRSNELYRLSSENEEAQSKFTSLVKEKEVNEDTKDDQEDEEPLAIDFGVSVLRWLSFEDEPAFDNLEIEMVQNKDSSVSQQGFDRMVIECAEKIKTEQFGDYELEELMGFKFYTDYSTDCANLRKAHWKAMPKEMKKRYYHWARTIYRAALRHAVPIPLQSGNKNAAKWLYHGLSLLFRMDQELPTYFGPFSTSLAASVADEFSDKKGLRLRIKAGYEDSTKRCLGVDMQSISCFKREREVLLVDQPIPIQSTKTWSNDAAVLVDHFLYSLKSRGTRIRDAQLFWKTLGIQYKEEWDALIVDHKLYWTKTKYQDKVIAQRLQEELGLVVGKYLTYDDQRNAMILRLQIR